MIEKFNIRVYGLLINENNEVLVTDEYEFGKEFTKFPGGGLELGEGLKDGLIREWKEELNQEIEVLNHFYTTDFFQQSGFNEKHQLISVYYLVKTNFKFTVKISQIPFDFENRNAEEVISFRWIKLDHMLPSQLTFPIDKLVSEMLLAKQ